MRKQTHVEDGVRQRIHDWNRFVLLLYFPSQWVERTAKHAPLKSELSPCQLFRWHQIRGSSCWFILHHANFHQITWKMHAMCAHLAFHRFIPVIAFLLYFHAFLLCRWHWAWGSRLQFRGKRIATNSLLTIKSCCSLGPWCVGPCQRIAIICGDLRFRGFAHAQWLMCYWSSDPLNRPMARRQRDTDKIECRRAVKANKEYSNQPHGVFASTPSALAIDSLAGK